MVLNRPPMGWNSWNTFGPNINEELIMSTADKLVEDGYRDAGYEYLVIDDCWSLHERDAMGKLVADPEKFPHGMKALADYVHGKGLKFGMYSCAGILTCAGYPASLHYEFLDAQTFAEWGVDYLKYDYCNKPQEEDGARLYRKMSLALKTCGREIVFSACSWGADGTFEWIKTTGCHLWRSTGDIVDKFESVRTLYELQKPVYKANGKGCFNDMDMLIVGMNGVGNVGSQLGFKGCNLAEYRTHFSIWCFFGSPLMIGSDIRAQSPETKALLMNREVLAINQDEAYTQPFPLTKGTVEGNAEVWCRILENGDMAVAVFNFGEDTASFTVSLDELGITPETRKVLEVRDLWAGKTLGKTGDFFGGDVEPHDSAMFRLKIVDKD